MVGDLFFPFLPFFFFYISFITERHLQLGWTLLIFYELLRFFALTRLAKPKSGLKNDTWVVPNF